MGPPNEVSGMGGIRRPEVGEFIHVSGAGGHTLLIGDMDDVPMYQKKYGWI